MDKYIFYVYIGSLNLVSFIIIGTYYNKTAIFFLTTFYVFFNLK